MEDNTEVNLENAKTIQELGSVEGKLESPIDLDISKMTPINLPRLQWIYYDVPPRKLKITNAGHTAVLSAKWQLERPYITGGPLNGNYVFSQMHFHWGETEMNGSEHQADGANMPMELHVVHFKTQYLKLDQAVKETDGVVIIVYFLKLQESRNIFLKEIVNALSSVRVSHSSIRLSPVVLTNIFQTFTEDYFVYWGSIVIPQWIHSIMWLVGREPIGISKEQINEFRNLCDDNDKPILGNCRSLRKRQNRNIFHVCPSGSLIATLLPISRKQLVQSSRAIADSKNGN